VQTSTQTGFLLLIVSQALHSIEEYTNSLWEVFAPARFISELFSDDLTTGFSVVNVSIVAFGFWCYFGPIRHSWSSATVFAWFWVLLELGNSIGHTYFAINQAGYFPGFYTVPPLFMFSCYLAFKLVKGNHEPTVT
jgi:hypothetical protein